MVSVSGWLNVAVAGTALVVSLGIGEGLLRAFVKLPPRRVLPEIRYAPHPVRRFTLLPDQEGFSYGAPARIDHRGFRVNGDQWPAPDQGPLVLALGDSFTFGIGVRNDETWPAQLQARLTGSTRRSVEVINAGTISYGAFQELDLLKSTGLATRPQIVVHALYWNDFMNASAPPPDAPPVVDPNGYFVWDQLSQPRNPLRALAVSATSSSALMFSVRQVAEAVGQPRKTTNYGDAYRRFLKAGLLQSEWQPIEQLYRELKRLSAEHDFFLFVVVMPVSDIVRTPAPASHAYPTAARRMLKELDIPFLDTFQLWTEQGYGMEHFRPETADAHLAPAGYRAVSEALSQALLRETQVLVRLRR